jgi:exosortase/archaeosortase family protein
MAIKNKKNHSKKQIDHSKKHGKKANSPPKNKFFVKNALFFLAKFAIIFTILNIFIEIADLSSLTNFIAAFSANALGLYSFLNVVLVGSEVFVVSNSCTGLVSASILASIIFSLKKPRVGKKILFLLAGVLILALINIPRVILVLYSAKLGFNAELVHEITWYLMSGAIILIWYYGSKKLLDKKEFGQLI